MDQMNESINHENNTIFDDVFRTMVEKMPELVIPVVNEVFHTSYGRDTKIEQLRNEHHTKEGEVVTDSFLKIGECLYHIECQSWPDSTMTVRMIEYDFAAALDLIRKEENLYEMDFPESCVLYLRHNSKTPDTLKMKVNFPGNESIIYSVPIIKVQEYTKDEIFEKNLLMFLPFYLLRYEKQLKKMDENPEELKRLIAEYEDIRKKLEIICTEDERSALYTDLSRLIVRIADYLLAESPESKERMDDVMGGKVLELESERLIRESKEIGMEAGMEEKGIQVYLNMMKRGYPESEARVIAGLSDEQIAKLKDRK